MNELMDEWIKWNVSILLLEWVYACSFMMDGINWMSYCEWDAWMHVSKSD